MITLTSPWHYSLLGCTFPVGTVFIPQLGSARRGRTVYSYATPNGGHGECLIDDDITPGQD